MKRFIFILGGGRSGKSNYAVALAKKLKKRTAFIATANPADKEMAGRINLHKKTRPRWWKLFEENKDISPVLSGIGDKYGVVVIDCLGIFISNLMESGQGDKNIESQIRKLIKAICKHNSTVIVVSNNVGSGLVPMNSLARRFRDLVGLSNQWMAKNADEVIFMQAGIPMFMKGERKNGKVN